MTEIPGVTQVMMNMGYGWNLTGMQESGFSTCPILEEPHPHPHPQEMGGGLPDARKLCTYRTGVGGGGLGVGTSSPYFQATLTGKFCLHLQT